LLLQHVILLARSLSQETQLRHKWRQLLGGFIKDGETIENTCDRIVKTQTGLGIDEIEPLAVVTNKFTCQSRTLLHHGLAFIAHTRGTLTLPPDHLGAYIAQPAEQLAYSNREIAIAAKDKVDRKRTFVPEDEIEVSQRYAVNYWIHKSIINRPFELLSSRLLRDKIKQFCDKAETIIDIACGDDGLILELAKTAKFCVANDISWETLKRLRRRNHRSNIIFTNHDATDLPFRKEFDVAICKNVLHHAHNLTELLGLLQNLTKVGDRLILIDIENPFKSTLRAKLWHSYYVRFLGDRGRYFLTKNEFEKVVSLVFQGAGITYDRVQTFKGNYMFAVIENPSRHVTDSTR